MERKPSVNKGLSGGSFHTFGNAMLLSGDFVQISRDLQFSPGLLLVLWEEIRSQKSPPACALPSPHQPWVLYHLHLFFFTRFLIKFKCNEKYSFQHHFWVIMSNRCDFSVNRGKHRFQFLQLTSCQSAADNILLCKYSTSTHIRQDSCLSCKAPWQKYTHAHTNCSSSFFIHRS